MKKLLFLTATLLLSGLAFAQKASQIIPMTMTEKDTIDLADLWSYTNCSYNYAYKHYAQSYIDQEKTWISKYAAILKRELQPEIDAKATIRFDISDMIDTNLSSLCERAYGVSSSIIYDFNDPDKEYLRPLLAKHKSLRDIIVNNACRLISEMVAFYPKDFKSDLEREFLYESRFVYGFEDLMNVDPKAYQDMNKYTLKVERKDEYNNDMVLRAYDKNGKNVRLNWWERRIYIDKIPIEELQDMAGRIYASFHNVDVSHNDDMMMAYKVNNDFLLCQGRREQYILLLNKKPLRSHDVLFLNMMDSYNSYYRLTCKKESGFSYGYDNYSGFTYMITSNGGIGASIGGGYYGGGHNHFNKKEFITITHWSGLDFELEGTFYPNGSLFLDEVECGSCKQQDVLDALNVTK